MNLLERSRTLRAANDAVVAFMYRHDIVRFWGSGRQASSDGMSLDAARHLWNARVDPRRRTFGVGTYQHLLDQWGIIYDQPIMLGTRQAGAAIEGALRQTVAESIERLAIDTHGYTDVAIGLAKLLGFDLCPRLKILKDRMLHVPEGIDVPDLIASIVRQDVRLALVETHWDELVRLVASIKTGRVSATAALKRFGSIANGDPLHRAAKALGQMERTVFLCHYLENSAFRRELSRNLSYGEALHALQRAIYFGSIAPKRGRRWSEMTAISAALALLTNIVMAWNTQQMQQVYTAALRGNTPYTPDQMHRIAPIHYRHINFNGQFRFPVAAQRDRLLAATSR